MEPFISKKGNTPKIFLAAGLFLLATGMFWGLTGALQYLVPGLLKDQLSFEKVRPLHVSSVIFWIIFGAVGGVFTYLQQHTGKNVYSLLLARLQLVLFILAITVILVSYLLGKFGGREYWEFPPLLALPFVAGWILFLVNFLLSIGSFRHQPVYIWMWVTGIVFFLFSFLESYLWLIPYFRTNVVNDMTIQWKSYGSMVGSWNMLIYGCSFFLMDKHNTNRKYSHTGIAFSLYFLGLFNLMFNWGHHLYTLPTFPYVKHIGYAVSMTELLIIGRIILGWRASVVDAKANYHNIAYRFLSAADLWIFLTLLLAIAMSVPALNVYSHGTHITVAHTMGATIGINSFLLLAIAFDILKDTCRRFEPYYNLFNIGFWLANVSLFIFWCSLIGAGVAKANWQLSTIQIPYSSMMSRIRPFFIVFFISGTAMLTGFLFMIYPLVKNQLLCFFRVAEGRKDRPGAIDLKPL